ncbi:hypothetical protein [Streptomyces sp. NPDC001135]
MGLPGHPDGSGRRGMGLAESALHDEMGPLGRRTQTLHLVARG